MKRHDETSSSPSPASDAFVTTHWSVVLSAAGSDTTCAQSALAFVCEAYWYPLYVFVRRRGYSAADAQDLTQGFFTKLLEKNYVADVDPDKGRFRSFLLTSIKHFLANEWDKSQAQKRGGGRHFIAIDGEEFEARYQDVAVDNQSPERLFDRQWTLALLERVLKRLRREYDEAGKGDRFEQLKGCISAAAPSNRYREIAQALQVSEGAVKVAVHRLRHRYRELLREEVLSTVGDDDQVDDELGQLFASLTV